MPAINASAPAERQQGSDGREAGMTLIELMVVVLLSAILSAGLFYMVAGQQQTYEGQIKAMTTQDNLRGTMIFVSQAISRAGLGFGGCPGGVIQQWTGSGPSVEDSPYVALRVYNDCDLSVTPPASCPDGSGADSFTSTAVEAIAVSTGTEIGVPAMRIADEALTSSSPLRVRSAGNFTRGDLIALFAPGVTHCTLLQVSGTPVNTGTWFELPHAGGFGVNPPDADNIFPTPEGYLAGALVIRLGPASGAGATIPRHFAVDRTTDPPRLVTWSTTSSNPSASKADLEVVADGIEDLQIAWACDANADGLHEENPASLQNDEWMGNVAADNLPACGRPEVARITLIARAAGPEPGFHAGFRPAAEDRAAGTVAEDLARSGGLGTYPRNTLTSTIWLRNVRQWNP